MDTRALRMLGVKVPEGYQQWQTLSELGLEGQYDHAQQQLALAVPAQWLPHQRFNSGNRVSNTPVSHGSGALLNYDIYSTHLDSGETSTVASHEARLFSAAGVFSSSGLWRWSDASPEYHGDYVRLDSYWRHTNAPRMRTYMVGDTISGALSWTPAIRLGGVQVSRNFASRPDLITYPLPQISGTASLPSALDVFVNGLQLTDQQILPGPYVLETAPRLTGYGEVQVVTTDTLGRQTAQSLPFYVAPTLLKPGLWDYSVSVGAPRRNYSFRSNDYDNEAVATANGRVGINDYLTLEGSGSAGQALRNGGLGINLRAGLLGVSNAALAHGEDDNDQGQQWVLGHTYSNRRYSFSAQYTERTRGYRDLSSVIDNLAGYKRSLQINGGINLLHQGSINASYLNTEAFSGQQSEFLVLAYSRNLWQRLSMNFSVNQNLNDSDDRTWLASFSYYLDRPGKRPIHAGARLSHDEQTHDTSSVFTLRQQTEEFWDVGWDLAYSPDPDGIRQASATWWTPYARAQAGVYGNHDTTNIFADLSGSLITSYDELFFANRMNSSYAIVDTGGAAGIPVRKSNRLIGYTNKNGKLLMPDLIPYVDNQLAIDIQDLPADTQVESSRQVVKPAELTGVRVDFALQQSYSAVAVVRHPDHRLIAAGSRVLLEDADATLAGYDGEVFLQNLQSGRNTLEVIESGSRCRVVFDFTPQPGHLPRIGPFTCQQDN